MKRKLALIGLIAGAAAALAYPAFLSAKGGAVTFKDCVDVACKQRSYLSFTPAPGPDPLGGAGRSSPGSRESRPSESR
jgi:hypothetical protein